ncbi:MAG: hypothetical protein SAJ72_17780, partial [Jaaginema sp. PMC 1080.18]|nr:hypothetical protein [Jaaginema sp. PMC 1080.18]
MRSIKKTKNKLLSYLNTPAYKLILSTANHHRKLIALSFNFNFLSSLLETGTFGIIYLSLGVLSGDVSLASQDNIFLNLIQVNKIATLSSEHIFVFLVVSAVVIQFLRSLCSYFS